MSDIQERKGSKTAQAIATLNDNFRQTFVGGNIYVTAGIQALGPAFVTEALAEVRSFKDFTEDNDPHVEHDFGSLAVNGKKIFWKIDYYDPSMEFGSEDPADPQKTTRVLTVMLAEEY